MYIYIHIYIYIYIYIYMHIHTQTYEYGDLSVRVFVFHQSKNTWPYKDNPMVSYSHSTYTHICYAPLYIYIYIYIYGITVLLLTNSLRGFVIDQIWYNLESTQYIWKRHYVIMLIILIISKYVLALYIFNDMLLYTYKYISKVGDHSRG